MDLRHQERLAGLRELIVGARRGPQQPEASRNESETGQPETAHEGKDWTETLELVHRAASRLVSTDERVRDLEAELRELSDSAAGEIQRLRAEVVDLQRQLDLAEAGRRHAEDWLRRLHTAVIEQFSAQLEPARETAAPISAAS
jgi:small-conductance mechanosensitive channel